MTIWRNLRYIWKGSVIIICAVALMVSPFFWIWIVSLNDWHSAVTLAVTFLVLAWWIGLCLPDRRGGD